MTESKADTFKIIPHHCGISVPDLEASIAWYRDMLGFSVVKRLTLDVCESSGKVEQLEDIT